MNIKRLAATALAYFALAFCAGFALGTVRVLWLVPRFGVRASELAEAPLMLLVVFFAARWVVKQFEVPLAATARLGIGLIALGLLLTFEFSLVLWLQGITLRESIANRDPVSGSVYAVSLVFFALMPMLVRRSRPISPPAH